MSLTGKRVLITGGAGFIGTTLARRLVDENELVAVDNLHRDALSGTELGEHANFTFVHCDVLDRELLAEVARGATHIVHCAGIAGVDRPREPGPGHARQRDRDVQRPRGGRRHAGHP
ncbi:MAG TPA: NAD-dependent epimerase/dehydratase family protein [Gaiellaceae bacterium]